MIKRIILFALIFSGCNLFAQSPLSFFSDEWNESKYAVANTAANVSYMNAEEKKVIYILNLARINPKLFSETVVKKYVSRSGNENLRSSSFTKSLISKLNSMSPASALQPDENCYSSAECHAISSGKKNYLGHERQTNECKKKQSYYGECCSYGYSNALDIVLTLLIDDGIATLGHRNIMLGEFGKCAVSIQPHNSNYHFNAVMDFTY